MICHTGEYEKGVDHLTNAIAVCGQPQQLLQVLQQTLPPPVFQMLLTKLPTISQVCEMFPDVQLFSNRNYFSYLLHQSRVLVFVVCNCMCSVRLKEAFFT